jgi:hypothetical protein
MIFEQLLEKANLRGLKIEVLIEHWEKTNPLPLPYKSYREVFENATDSLIDKCFNRDILGVVEKPEIP